ncbi:hypothetical protein DWW30_15610 [Bacteroides sp. AF15-14LB]|uniref:Uncharacterized protein n=3 Tax=Bacteroides TaxID=816 RepID=A0A412MNC6_BACUN|nr:hypothetical protein DWX87_14325 [Bacteroides uniformis]RGT21258.1 hypothetical protein DWX44_12235 [Bacteroides uniformis]RJV37147.1 hypothetical protein DWY55_11745 [Bacteroides sp. AF25-38AC]RJV55968.1 hypothetical protein DWW72_16240 [Bacteroides sp. AF16-7]RJV68188.1 hypothetical protein DWW30_15610 [Bacteroides sp. AF15-14LB]
MLLSKEVSIFASSSKWKTLQIYRINFINRNTMAEKERFIKADASQQEAIAKQFFTTTRTVRSALNFETNSPFAKTLRAYALNHGCKMYEVTLIDNPYEKVKTL